MTNNARCTQQIDADGIRVTRYDMEPGDHIARHRHEYDYLVIPLNDGVFEVMTDTGSSVQRTSAGEPYQRQAGAEHELVNGESAYSFIEIEFTQQRSE